MSSVKSFVAKMESKGRHEYIFSCPSSICLSFAVRLVDDYTQKEPLGDVRVTVKGEQITNVKALKNLSGYYIFSGLPEGRYTLSVESEHYFSEEKIVDTSSFVGSKEPVVEVFLRPRPSYPFPDRATLLRGMLATEFDLPSNITVRATSVVTGRETRGIPDEKGEFVLYFREIVKGKADVVLEVKGEGIEKTLPASIEEGRSIYVGFISIS
jgi:hypothetical protein